MKKLLSISLIAFTLAFTACGPSAEEKAAAEQARQDSIALVTADSMRIVVEDSMMMAQKMMEDSIRMKAMEDSLMMMKESLNKPKPKAKTPEEKKIEEVKKATQGRG